MKKSYFLLSSVIFLSALFSCGSNDESNSGDTLKTDSPAVASTPAEATSASYKALVIKHPVADFNVWKPAFVEHNTTRKEYGLTDVALLKGIDDPKLVMIVEKITDVQKAKDFTQLPNLKEVMQKAGVTGKPEFAYYDVIRNDDSEIGTKDRVIVTHKVKDFDAWLKIYDGEGKETRAGEGMVDRVLARGIDDPNMVHIVFAVTDMAKAKTAITSEAKKKLMMSAGVEGMPVIEYFQLID